MKELNLENYNGKIIDYLRIESYQKDNQIDFIDYQNFKDNYYVKADDTYCIYSSNNTKSQTISLPPKALEKDIYYLLDNYRECPEIHQYKNSKHYKNMFEVNLNQEGKDIQLTFEKDKTVALYKDQCIVYNQNHECVNKIKFKGDYFYDQHPLENEFYISYPKNKILYGSNFQKNITPFLNSVLFTVNPTSIQINDTKSDHIYNMYQYTYNNQGMPINILSRTKMNLSRIETLDHDDYQYYRSIRPLVFDSFNFLNTGKKYWCFEYYEDYNSLAKIYTRKVYYIPEYKIDRLIYDLNSDINIPKIQS